MAKQQALRLFALAALLTAPVFANATVNSFVDYGRVLSATPVYKYVNVRKPNRVCRPYGHRRNHTGNRPPMRHQQPTHHNTRRNGIDVSVRVTPDYSFNAPVHRVHRRGPRCTTTVRVHRERRTAGFNVTYRYRGQTFRAHSKTHPGKRIAIRVSLRPQ